MGERVVLLGAGGGTGEVISLIRHSQSQGACTWDLVGILDDDESLRGQTRYGLPVLGTLDHARELPDVRFLSGIANSHTPSIRLRVAARMAFDESRWMTFISPLAFIADTGRVGVGSIVYPGAVVSSDASVGRHCVVYYQSIVHHHSTVDDGCCIAAAVSIAGFTHVGKGCYLGMGAKVKDRITIGDGALVGVGSVVIANVPPGQKVAGVPARAIGTHA